VDLFVKPPSIPFPWDLEKKNTCSICIGKTNDAFEIGIKKLKLMSVKSYSSLLMVALFPT
jgi:hypothetical protein